MSAIHSMTIVGVMREMSGGSDDDDEDEGDEGEVQKMMIQGRLVGGFHILDFLRLQTVLEIIDIWVSAFPLDHHQHTVRVHALSAVESPFLVFTDE